MNCGVYTYWGKVLYPTQEYRRPLVGEYFVDMDGDPRMQGKDGHANGFLNDGKRTILSLEPPPEPVRKPDPIEPDGDFEPPSACYCAASSMPPCSWCTSPDRGEEA